MGAICRRPDDRHVQVQKARPSPLAKPNIVSNHSSSQPLAFTTSRTRRPSAVRVDVRHRHVGRCWYRLDVHPGRTVSPNLRSRFRRISTPENFRRSTRRLSLSASLTTSGLPRPRVARSARRHPVQIGHRAKPSNASTRQRCVRRPGQRCNLVATITLARTMAG
jgi:hypothetical protein